MKFINIILLLCLSACNSLSNKAQVSIELSDSASCYSAGAKNYLIMGREECVSLLSLKIPLIQAKVDTGAEVSTLDARHLKIVKKDGKSYASFLTYPIQKDESISVEVFSEIVGSKDVTSSNGQTEVRPIIKSMIKIGQYDREIRLTLTDRSKMEYRMLLGKEAMQGMLVEPSKSYCQGKTSLKNARLVYHRIKKD